MQAHLLHEKVHDYSQRSTNEHAHKCCKFTDDGTAQNMQLPCGSPYVAMWVYRVRPIDSLSGKDDSHIVHSMQSKV